MKHIQNNQKSVENPNQPMNFKNLKEKSDWTEPVFVNLLKVHKRENFLASNIDICTFS